MTVFTDVRAGIADQLCDAANLIGHFGLSTSKPFDTASGVNLALLTDATLMNLSPIGAIVMAQHINDVGFGWDIPNGWDRGDYWTRYPALGVFAQYLALNADDEYAGADTPADVINTWARHPAAFRGAVRTEQDVVETLHAAADAVRNSGPDSQLLAVMT